jgi:4'-phosphopantetheinyl transferase
MEHFLRPEWTDSEGRELAISPRAVHIWQIRPSNVFLRYLTSAEALRHEGIANEEVKQSYGCSQGGLRKIVSLYRECFPNSVKIRCQTRGKPYVVGGPEFNLTHTAGRIFAALASQPVGLDAESADRNVRALALARKFFHARESAGLESLGDREKAVTFLRYWVCKEATVKLSGDGIYLGLRYAQVDLAADGRSRGHYKGRKVWLREFQPAEGLLAALASWEPLEMKSFFQV